jgi:hypothetical protein
MRPPVATRTKSSLVASAVGSALRRGEGLRNDSTNVSARDAPLAIAFNRACRCALLRSTRDTHKRARPTKTAVPAARSISSNNSWPANAEGFEELFVEPEAFGAGNEIGAHSGGFVNTFEMSVLLLATVLEREELPRSNDIALHTRDLDHALHPPDPIPHALDMYDEVESARNLHTDRLERQIEVRHHHHVFDAVERVTRGIGVDCRH